MYISYNWLKELTDFSYSPVELDSILTMLGIEVEHIVDYGKKYNGFLTAHVIKKEKHFNADKLSVCVVDCGDSIKTVVCGAPNVEAGQKVILGLAGAVVPQNGMTLEKRAVRKIESDGMICSRFELGLDDDHSGIWVLDKNTPVGLPLAEYLNSNDTIFEISITPNRSDCLSHFGIAREIVAYNNCNNEKKSLMRIPELNLIESGNHIESGVEVIIEDIEKCLRYSARVVKNVKIQESPDWLKQRLILLGLRPINAVVDVTNIVLMECGQPLHAFDLHELESNKIVVKTVSDGYKFKTLDGKERILDSSMLMICDGRKPVAIGGVMGGENSEISDKTTDILLESAYFDPGSIRRTSKKLGIQSEASYRFERGVDIDNIIYALDRAAQLIAELTGGTIEKGKLDVYPVKKQKAVCKLRYKRACGIIGAEIANGDIKKMLLSLNFNIISEDAGSVTVEAPSYRVDIAEEIDLIEEIAIMNNYVGLEPDFSATISSGSLKVPDELAVPQLREKIGNYLVNNGFHECLTQNQTDPVSAKLFTEDYLTISNPLGEELSVMRPSMIPSMLKTIEINFRHGNSDLKLFEIGRSFHKIDKDEKTFIEDVFEKEEIIIALAGRPVPKQWSTAERKIDFYDIKGVVDGLFKFLRFDNIAFAQNDIENIVFSKNSLKISSGNKILGFAGEVKKPLLKKYDIENDVYLIRIELSELYKVPQKPLKYKLVSAYPPVSRDLAFIAGKDITSETLKNEIIKNGGSLLNSVDAFDVYSGKNIGEGLKSIAFSIRFSSPERTLIESEVDEAVNKIVAAVEKNTGAKWRRF